MTCGGIEFIVYVSLAKSRSENECGPKDTLVEPVPTVLSSNQFTPVAKESGATSLANSSFDREPDKRQIKNWLRSGE